MASAIRRIARSSAILLLGRESRPRTILRGLASGYRICVSPAEHLSYLIGTYEPHLQKAIRNYVTRGGTVYDIGANMGFVALACAKQVGPRGRVIAFEPLPANAALLRKNVAENKLVNIHVVEAAASDRSGKGAIRVAENSATASMIWHQHDFSAKEIAIQTVAVDDLVSAGDLPQPTFIKVDVEGAEGQAVQGMRRTLAAAMPVAYIECSDSGRESTWRIFRELGYQCRSADETRAINDFEAYRHSDFIWLPPTMP